MKECDECFKFEQENHAPKKVRIIYYDFENKNSKMSTCYVPGIGPDIMANRWGNNGNSDWLYLGGDSKITADGDCSHEIERCFLLGRKVMTNLDSILKIRGNFANKGWSSHSYGFSSSHVWMWELGYKESWVQKNWYFWTLVLEKTLESPLDCKEIQPVHPKGNQSWIFIVWTDAEAETPILWPPDTKNWLIGKDYDAGKDWRQEERGRQRMRRLDGIPDSLDMGLSKFW